MILELNKSDSGVLGLKSSTCIPILDDGVASWEEDLVSFVMDMKETLASISGGSGLASNQVWEGEMTIQLPSVFAILIDNRIIECINPIVKNTGRSFKNEEACLSFPGRTKPKRRHKNSTLIFQTLEEPGQQVSIKVTGMLARTIQHEIDHLNGKTLFPLRLEGE